jgi:hypothetical protein
MPCSAASKPHPRIAPRRRVVASRDKLHRKAKGLENQTKHTPTHNTTNAALETGRFSLYRLSRVGAGRNRALVGQVVPRPTERAVLELRHPRLRPRQFFVQPPRGVAAQVELLEKARFETRIDVQRVRVRNQAVSSYVSNGVELCTAPPRWSSTPPPPKRSGAVPI